MTPTAATDVPRGSLLTNLPATRESIVFAGLLALFACLPFLAAQYPQMTDYPSHLARWHVMIDGGHSPWLARHYAFQWRWTGNLGTDILIWPFARLFGLELGGRIMAALVPVLSGFALMRVEWALRRRIGVGTLLAFATIWSRPLTMGFLNFGLALALALFAFSLWVRMEGNPRRWLPFIPIALAVWLCHIAGWGVLGLLVACYELQRRFSFASLLAPWPLAFPALATMIVGGGSIGPHPWGGSVYRYKVAMWMQAMRDRWFELDVDSLILIALALIIAALARKFDRRLGWAALVFAILTLAMPRHFGGGDYADLRLTAVALMVGCLAIDWQAPRWAFYLAPALFLLRLGVSTEAWIAQSHKTERLLTILDHVPEGARVAVAVAEDPLAWPLNSFEHSASYATIRRQALVNTHFAIPGVHMLRVRDASPDFADPSFRIFVEPGQRLDLSAFEPAREADWLWFIGDHPPATLPKGAEVVYRAQDTLLAHLPSRPAAVSAAATADSR